MIGSLAPGFDLPCTQVREGDPTRANLARYRGQWLVLVFYPRDFSLVCPTELSALSGRIEEFERQGCAVLGVSTDDLLSHRRWIDTPRASGGLGGLRFPLASDEEGAAAQAYGVYLPMQRVSLRGLFIIDPNGVLQYQVVHNLSIGRRSDEVLRVLAGLQTGGLCSEGWSPDQDTIEATQVVGPGSVVAHYRLSEELGSGTFASVYRAHDLVLERTVALKIIKNECPIARGRVMSEARLAAALNHPNICTIYAVDESEGVPVIAMEFLHGRTLAQLLQDGPLPVSQAARFISQVASGMALAHAVGIVHGDLKPANVMITEGGAAKILDFGLSRRSDHTGPTDDTASFSGSAEGFLSGTPRYMAPEQAQGKPATPASDVFALGLMVYEVISGRQAFDGTSLLELLGQIARVDAEQLAAGLPDPFAGIVREALVANPASRTISMQQICDLLSEVAVG